MPFKPKRRTKAQIAREAGLEPLADALLTNPALMPEAEAAKFVDADKGVADAKAALDGARHILIERIGEDAGARRQLARMAVGRGHADVEGDEGQGRRKAPSSPTISTSASASRTCPRTARSPCCAAATRASSTSISTWRTRRASRIRPRRKIKVAFGIAERGRPADAWLAETVRLAWKAQARPVARSRSAGAPQGARRRRGDLGVLQQPERPAAGRAGRPARHHGPRPRHPHRRQGRGRRPDRQGRRHDDHLSARAASATGQGSLARAGRPVHASTRSTSSASATAPPAARPTSWSPS